MVLTQMKGLTRYMFGVERASIGQMSHETSALIEDGDDTSRADQPVVVVPLNSHRLVTQQVCQLAAALSLPMKASPADLRQMVEERLIADGREPRNMQVRQFDGSVLLELQTCLESL